jgi:hypothetical protein
MSVNPLYQCPPALDGNLRELFTLGLNAAKIVIDYSNGPSVRFPVGLSIHATFLGTVETLEVGCTLAGEPSPDRHPVIDHFEVKVKCPGLYTLRGSVTGVDYDHPLRPLLSKYVRIVPAAMKSRMQVLRDIDSVLTAILQGESLTAAQLMTRITFDYKDDVFAVSVANHSHTFQRQKDWEPVLDEVIARLSL